MSAGVRRSSVPNLESLRVDSKRGDAALEVGKRGVLQAIRRELGQLAHLGWAVVLTQCLYYTIGTAAIIFAGHRGKTELDVVAISTVVLNLTATAVAQGLSGYCDTLFSQVYGSKEKKRLGAVLQKCLLIMSVAICPSLGLHMNMQSLLQLIGYESNLARLTEQYLLIHIPGTIAVYFYIVLAKYIQNQNREIPILIIAGIGNAVNVSLHAVFFIWLETGVWGSAVSLCITYVTLLLSTIMYILLSGIYKDTWQGWTSEGFLSWAQYCKLGMYSLFIHLIECWAFESGIILSGLLGPDLIAAQSIVFQVIAILYTIPWGIGMVGGIRVGQHLGANDPKSAKLSARVTLGTAVTLGFFFFVLIVSLRYYIPLIYTKDRGKIRNTCITLVRMGILVSAAIEFHWVRNVVELVASVLPIVGVMLIFDYLGGSMNGVLRGSGRQGIGIAFTIPAMIFVMGCGLTLMFKTSLHIKGFWLAVLCAIIFQASVGTIFLCRLNWKQEAEKTQIRVKTSGGQIENIYVIKPMEEDGADNPAFKSDDKGLEHGTIGIITTLPEEDGKKVPMDLHKDEAPAHFTKKLVFYRAFTFGLSFGCLIAGLIIRNVMYITDTENANTNFTVRVGNGTTMATYSMFNGTLDMDNVTTAAQAHNIYNGTVF